jgi:hypothetical protein
MCVIIASSSPLTTVFEPLDAKSLYTGAMRDVAEYSVRDRVTAELSRVHSYSGSSSRLRSHSTENNNGNVNVGAVGLTASGSGTGLTVININGSALATPTPTPLSATTAAAADHNDVTITVHGNDGVATAAGAPVPAVPTPNSTSTAAAMGGDGFDDVMSSLTRGATRDERKIDSFLSSLPSSHHHPSSEMAPLARITIPIVPSSPSSSSLSSATAAATSQPVAGDALAVPPPNELVHLHFDRDVDV